MALPDVLATELPKHYDGDLSQFQPDYVQGRLDEVVDKITVRWGALVEARLASGALPTRLYTAIVCRLATRVFRNPDGFRSETEGAYQYSLSAAVASGTLWFTEDDERDLTGRDPRASQIGTATIGRHRPGWV